MDTRATTFVIICDNFCTYEFVNFLRCLLLILVVKVRILSCCKYVPTSRVVRYRILLNIPNGRLIFGEKYSNSNNRVAKIKTKFS